MASDRLFLLDAADLAFGDKPALLADDAQFTAADNFPAETA